MKTSNDSQKTIIFRCEMWGILFIILFGALLHFAFELSGGWRPLGVISAVNESVWEHLKLAFWPAIIWTIIEFFFVRRPAKDTNQNFILAKAIGAYIMPLVIVVVFYSYTAFTGESILVIDLLSFVIAVVIGQVTSYKLWSSLELSKVFDWLGLVMILVAVLLFTVFTFYTPGVAIFKDPVTGGYGIIE